MKTILKPLDVVEVRGMPVPCSKKKINDIMGCTFQNWSYLKEIMLLKIFKDIKAWIALLSVIPALSWLKEAEIIKIKEINIPAWFKFKVISNNLMPS